MLLFHQVILHVLTNILERISKIILIIDDKRRDQKLRYDINKEAAKTSALSSKNIDKYEHITSEDILHSDQRRVIKQAKSTFFFFRKSFRKINKND